MASVIYALCALTSLTCAVLLYRAFIQRGVPVLLWSCLCFTGLTISNILLVLDRIVYPMYDLSIPRLVAALVGLLLLIVGLILEGH